MTSAKGTRATASAAATLALLASLLLLPQPGPALAEEEGDPDLVKAAEEYFAAHETEVPAVETPDFGPGEHVVSAWEDGEISTDELVRYGLLSVTDPDEVPEEYRPHPDLEIDRNSYVGFILSHLDDADEETREWTEEHFESLVEAPPQVRSQSAEWEDCEEPVEVVEEEFRCSSQSANFELFYRIAPQGLGLPEVDESPANGRVDGADAILEALESAYGTYRGMGLSHPGSGRISVILSDTLVSEGTGYVPPALRRNGAPIIMMSGDPEYNSNGSRRSGQYNYLPRHELFHVFQYDYFRDDLAAGGTMNWWMEATAEWATGESLKSGSGVTLYARNLEEFLEHPERALNAHDGLAESRPYGTFVLANYLTEAVSPNFVADTWRIMDDAGTPVAAIRYTAGYYGRGLDELLLGFAVSNYRLDSPTDLTFALGARDGYHAPHAQTVWRNELDGSRPARRTEQIGWGSTHTGSVAVGPGGATYVEFGPRGDGDGRLTIDLTGGSDFRYALVTWPNGSGGRPSMEPLNHQSGRGDGQVVVPLSSDQTATLVATRTGLVEDSGDAEADRATLSWSAALGSSGGGDNIMVVGDSITHGNEGSHSWRFVLDRHLEAAGESVDFVGPRVGAYDIHTDIRNRAILDGQDPPPQEYYPGPSTARYMNNDFDRDHNAMWGWTFADANDTIRRDVADHGADYLLIGLGFNDITWGYSDAAGTVASARTMIQEARAANPDIRILISNVVTRTPLPGFEWLNGEIREYGGLLEAEVSALSTSRSPVHLVDISSGFDPYAHAWDGLHPNTRGDYLIGSEFANALHSEFGLGAPYGSLPSDPPDVELGQVDWISAGVTDQGFRLSWAREFGASGYYIWSRDATLAEPWELLPLPAPGDYFNSTWVRDGHTYEFRVAPVRGDQVGPISEVASAVADPKTLPGPSNVRAGVDGRDVLVQWDHRSGATGYRVYWIEAVGDYPVMNHAYVEARGDDRYLIEGLTPGMTYNVGVSTVNYYGPGIPSGVLNDVVIPGSLAARSADTSVEMTWDPRGEVLQGTEELWVGYPEGASPILEEGRAAELTEEMTASESPDLAGDERVHTPVAPRREEDE